MATIREITTIWGLPSGTGHVSVMYFSTTPTIASQRTALQAFWTTIGPSLASTVGWTVATTGRELDAQTGVLTGAWSENTAKAGFGTGGSVPIPDAAMLLIQWRTGTIVNGRFLRGRTFIPGASTGAVVGGNVTPAVTTAMVNAGSTLAGSAADLLVWHRPIAGSGGTGVTVTSVTAWSEYAVLRKRRG